MALQNAPNEYFTNIDYNPSFYESTSTSEYDLLYLKKTGIASSTAVTTFSNSVVVPTMILSDSSTNVSTTAFVKNQLYATLSYVITSINNIFSGTNSWTGTNSFNTFLPTTTLTPTLSYQFITKLFGDNTYGGKVLNNTWSGQNIFNSVLPTSTIVPTINNELTNKSYVDSVSGSSILSSSNSWLGHNTFNVYLPTSASVPSTPNDLTNKSYVDTSITNLNIGNYALTTSLNTAINNIYSQNLIPFTGSQTFNNGITIASNKILTLSTGAIISANNIQVSDINLSYLNGATSNIQSQITNYNTVQHGWTALQIFRLGVNILTNTTLQFGTGANISTNGLTITDVELGYLDGLSSNVQNQITNYNTVQHTWTTEQIFQLGLTIFAGKVINFGTNSGILVNNILVMASELAFLNGLSSNVQNQLNAIASIPTLNNTWTGSSNTFNNIVYFDSSNANTSITNVFDSLQCYGINGISFNCGGTNNTNSTSSFTFSPNYLLSTSPILCSDSISSGNSFLSPYLNTYNNYPLLTSPLISNVQTANLTNLTATVKTQSTTFTSDNLCSILYPNNSNQSINISIPISSGVQTGTFGPSSIGTFKSNNVLSNYNFLIYNGAILIDTIPAIMISGGVLSSGFNGTCNALGGTTNWNYQQFMSNFSLAYTPPISTSSITYNIKFQCTLTLTVTYTGTISILSGLGYMKFNTTFSGNANSSAGFSLGAVSTGSIGTNYAIMTILINDNNNITTQSGTTYVNNLITSGNSSLNNVSLNTSPILSYTTLPTYASNQIGYSVPVTYTIGTALSTGVFKILATSDLLPIGNYNVYWTTHANFTGATGNITVGQYGVVFSNTIPLGLSGSSLIENHNQTAYYLHNQVYTSSAYVSPSTTGYKMYLGIWATFATVLITPTNLSNLQVIRTS